MEQYEPIFHKRPMAGIALGALLAVLGCAAFSDAVLLVSATFALCTGLILLFRGKPFAALLCAFSLFVLRIVLLGGVALPTEGKLVELIRSVRSACDAALEALFGENAGSAKGILLGDKADIAPGMLEQYRRAGLSHILAVSGLHVTILCTALQFALRGLRAWLSMLITLLFLLFYGALTGFSPSFCRAALMFFCVMLARAVGRRYDFLSAFCFAFSCILFVSPSAFYSVSFQLSFCCIYGMLMLTKPLSRLMHLPVNGVVSPVTAFAVQLGILPVAAYYFASVSTVGVLLSILVVPLIPLFIVPAFAAMLLYFASPAAAQVVAFIPGTFLAALNAVCAWTDSLPVSISRPPVAVIALYLIAMLLVSPFYLPNAKRPPYLGLAVAAVSVLLWILL